ncbi:MAG: Asp-tRNA(Asn)/Glu-tRNA(Gln) amidotransferase subunit GatC [Nitrospirota bacterium]|nr:MAG: Asp-tRNA(Asn)/Glu-tRNA(Gln) amidotransferase subunit GatC [Nitrospirota bacterium]
MKIDKSEVEHVARLARLEIGESEKDPFSEQLSQILKYMDQLGALNTEGVPQTATVREQTNVFQEDVPHPCLSTEQATANAPQTEEGFFLVPRILNDR